MAEPFVSGLDPQAQPSAGEAEDLCPDCRQPLLGPYCHRCGEKRVDRHDLKIRHFAGHVAHELTHLEKSKIPRTLAALVFHPGLLTSEYLDGRRKRYLAPLGLFLVLFGLFLFVYSVYRPAAIFDIQKVARTDRTGKMASFLVDRQAAKKGLTPEAFVEKLEERWHHYVSLLEIANVVFFALLLKLVYWRSRRYLVEHFIFSLHLFSFFVLLSILRWPVILLVGADLSAARYLVVGATVLIMAIYIFLAIRRVYGQSPGITLIKSAVLSAGLYLIFGATTSGSLMLAYVDILNRG
jgi:hypothetical protein